MLSAYPACFYKENNGGYSVIFPDLNHLATCGDDLEEAFIMAIDCLAGHIYYLKKNNEVLPKPTDIKKVDMENEYQDFQEAFVNIVAVDVEEYAKKHFESSVKKTLTIPTWLNDMAMEKNINFSGLLQEALKEKLNIS
ncbi:MAG: type II toxin-antitoxin system HicB family antitoxin [Oscillospiraceae bacterium]